MIDCDELRRNYAAWPHDRHVEFYSRVWREHPAQRHADHDMTAAELGRIQPERVVEVGGWDGSLAVDMLNRLPGIAWWVNVEVCAEAVERGRSHARYWPEAPGEWFWEWAPGNLAAADVLVASHTIEHLSADHLAKLVEAADVEWLLFDAPLADGPTDWWGSPTTHVLEVGWDGVTGICARAGFELDRQAPHATPDASGGSARMVTYRRL